jgi:hypothetical protein
VRSLATFGRFWYDFLIGDDWTIALAAVVAVSVTALLAHQGVPAWWVMPLGVGAILALSIGRATRASRT